MKRILLSIVFLLGVTSQTFAQTPQDLANQIQQVQKDLSDTKSSLNSSISALQKENKDLQHQIDIIKEINDELKKKYKMFQGVQVQNIDGIEYKTHSVIGNKGAKEIKVVISIINNTNSAYTIKKFDCEAVDENANSFTEASMKIGTQKNPYDYNLQPDTPVKLTYILKGSPESKYLRKFNFVIAYKKIVSLDGMQIDWK